MKRSNVRSGTAVLAMAAGCVTLAATSAARGQIYVYNTPVVYDTTPGDFTETQAILHDGQDLPNSPDAGLIKNGPNTLFLSQPYSYGGYNGPTVINGGTVSYVVDAAANGGYPVFPSSQVSLASGASILLNVGTADAHWTSAVNFSGSGTVVKTGSFALYLNGPGHVVNLSAGALIDVQQGTLDAADYNSNDTGQFDNTQTWLNNQANIRIAAGATFDTQMATVYAGGISGAGSLVGGYYYYRTINVGAGGGSGVFTGLVGGNSTFPTGVNITKIGAGSQVFGGASTIAVLTVNGGAMSIVPASSSVAVIGGATPFAGNTSVTVAPNSADVASLTLGAGTTVNATTFSVSDSADAGVGSVTQTGGTVNAQGLNLAQQGNNASASYSISGGALNVGANGIKMSQSQGSSSALTISGGAVNLYGNSSITFGNFYGRPSTVVQTGGTVTFYSDSGVTPGGSGSLALGSSAYVTPANYRLGGGTLSVPGFSYFNQAATNAYGAVGNFFFVGGTLAPSVDTGDFTGEGGKTQASNAVWNLFVGTGGGTINTGAHNVTILVPLTHDPSLGNNVDGGIRKAGSGTLTLGGTANSTYTGNTTVTGGVLKVMTPLRPVTGSLVVTGPGAVANLAAAPTAVASAGYTVAGEFSAISVTSSGAVKVPVIDRSANKATVLIAGGLSVSGGGSVDLGDSDLIVKGGNASAIGSLIHAGSLFASSASPSAAPFTTLGVIGNNDGTGSAYFGTYDGVTLTSSDAIVKFTYVGDTDLNGVVDGSDLANLLAGMNGGLTGWVNGDLNYDGVVNGTDLSMLMNGLRGQGTPLGDGAGGGGSGAVPEPASLALLAGGVPLVLRRRR